MSAHVRERLSAFLDGELDAGERSEVVAHLASCPECSAFLDELARVDEELARLPVPEPGGDDAFAARVRVRIEEESAPRKGRSWGTPRPLPAWGWAAAAALVLAVVAPLTWRELRPPSVGTEATTTATTALSKGAPQRNDVDRLDTREVPASEPATRSFQPAVGRRRLPATAPAPAAPAPTTVARPRALSPAPSPAPVTTEAALPAPAPAGLDAARGYSEGAEPEEKQRQKSGGAGLVDQTPEALADRPAPPRAAGFAVAPQAQALGGIAAKPPEEAPPDRQLGPERREATRETAKGVALDEERPPRTVEEWRLERERWRRRVAADPEGPGADQARLREIEAAAQAYRLGRDEEDARILKRDVAEYLARPHAPQSERVHRLLGETLP